MPCLRNAFALHLERMLFETECPALQNVRIEHLGPADFADKRVLINNHEDVAGFLLEIDLSVR